jgi:hypothetical protein
VHHTLLALLSDKTPELLPPPVLLLQTVLLLHPLLHLDPKDLSAVEFYKGDHQELLAPTLYLAER